jgi:hypothetical protein
MSIAAMVYVAIFVLCTSTIAVILGSELVMWWRARTKN